MQDIFTSSSSALKNERKFNQRYNSYCFYMYINLAAVAAAAMVSAVAAAAMVSAAAAVSAAAMVSAAAPIEVAEYAVSNKLVEEPAFAWWVPEVIRQKHRIISEVKS
jgi:hypothetical protein